MIVIQSRVGSWLETVGSRFIDIHLIECVYLKILASVFSGIQRV
ncbi:hypothetical protein VQ7734_03859 [Vibrio quintilis]|uniref:Uncharacterized protein n=1 Tax=Vibrio quintilis TaxID=1117707 RepID=A0A1M7YZH7_9VIBR|nr:hypothetical protein VQ7734_03859 [Vibrio quintilis]